MLHGAPPPILCSAQAPPWGAFGHSGQDTTWPGAGLRAPEKPESLGVGWDGTWDQGLAANPARSGLGCRPASVAEDREGAGRRLRDVSPGGVLWTCTPSLECELYMRLGGNKPFAAPTLALLPDSGLAVPSGPGHTLPSPPGHRAGVHLPHQCQ